MTAPYTIGVTGGIATGKSTVMAMLAELGAETIDADAVYHELIEPGRPLWERLRSRFGDDIVADDGRIDRSALAKIVFADPDTLAVLDALTHPAVIDEVTRLRDASDADVVAIEAVKLVESGLSDQCDEVWLVTADGKTQRDRLERRNDLSAGEAALRINAQPDDERRRAAAQLVMENTGTLETLWSAVERRWRDIRCAQALGDPTPILPK